jgi:hypothetical protein
MQSSESSKKRSRKGKEETAVVANSTPVDGIEEPTKARRKAPAKKSAVEATPAAKQHRGAAKKAAAAVATSTLEVRHEEIAKLAYSYWERRGYQDGSAEEDWFRAEAQLRS